MLLAKKYGNLEFQVSSNTHNSYKAYLETSQLYLPTTQPCIVAFVITICTIIVHPKKGEFSRRFQSKKATLKKKSARDSQPQIDHAQKFHLSHDQL